MEPYYKLIFDSNLYPKDFITTFGQNNPHWRTDDDRKKELSLRHDMCCVLLCNMELNTIESNLLNIQNKYKRKREESFTEEAKRPKIQETEHMDTSAPSTSAQFISSTVLTSSSSSSFHSETIDDPEDNYRFWLLEGMENVGMLQHNAATEFKCNIPTSQFDIIDRKYNKFIELKVTYNALEAVDNFEKKRHNIMENSSLCIVNPKTGDVSWVDHPGDARGISKVKAFIINRFNVVNELQIKETAIQEVNNLEDYIFKSTLFNKDMENWMQDIRNCYSINIPYQESEENYNFELKLITPTKFLNKLTNLQENSRTEYITFKGKICPEQCLYNFETNLEKDSEIIQFVTGKIADKKVHSFNQFNTSSKSIITDETLSEILELLKTVRDNTFNVDKGSNITDKIGTYLGIGQKQRTFNPADETTIQPTYKEMKNKKYHPWIGWMLKTMSNSSPHTGEYIPYKNLLEEPIEKDHTMVQICEKNCNKIMEKLLKTNTAVNSSRYTNMFSRLGGSYLVRGKQGEFARNNISVFPTYSTLRSLNNSNVRRLVSGIVIRGPHHAKSSTDKINFLHIEFLNKDQTTISFMNHIQNASVYELENLFILIRQTAISKEDTCYMMFTHNSLFVPVNFLGNLTIDNPNIPTNQNIDEMIDNTIEESHLWICERFTEGFYSATIGTSRDEGYFAGLRKIFMIVLLWKRKKVCASLDLDGLCDSINECLVDSPLSFSFHHTICKIIKFYDETLDIKSLTLL